ncbi:MAG: CfrBI family restriction endonuclease [Sphingobacteriales bacterium]|nr:MAG: CfrBI family restriction endonuclease [Sphingobacteriales bacterium]
MTLTNHVVKNIIKRLIKGLDYRIEVIALINAEFLQFAIDFFKKVIEAKLLNQDVSIDWYKKIFLNNELSSDEIAINSGLNKKTITNMYNSASKGIVIDASNEHYDILYQTISSLIENQQDIDLIITIKFRGISVELNINESLIVINTLAVKRSALRGGLWSTAGKRVEKYLMATLCKVYSVPFEHFDQSKIPPSMREVDFYLINNETYYRCEVKLMGRGNPESADAIFARESNVFVADKLSDLNKQQADKLNVKWVELRDEDGYKKFGKVLGELAIPHKEFEGDLDNHLDKILNEFLE